MSDLFSSSTSFDDHKSTVSSNELEEFIMMEKQKAQFNAQIHEFSGLCWDKCIDKPGSKLDGRTETCLVNCVNRFIDVSLLITNRFTQMLQKNAEAFSLIHCLYKAWNVKEQQKVDFKRYKRNP